MRDETGRGPLQMWSVLVVLGLVLLAVVFPAALAVGAGGTPTVPAVPTSRAATQLTWQGGGQSEWWWSCDVSGWRGRRGARCAHRVLQRHRRRRLVQSLRPTTDWRRLLARPSDARLLPVAWHQLQASFVRGRLHLRAHALTPKLVAKPNRS
jgi:hypothetical protein